nr:GNAT family N-acetyltransferase [Acidobacteriota bacterium]NIM61548.1 GNAT family N-acetyltransferase [Acidobacteriota bacterium]NIO60559.1 GNAT family N-acetyltransferase [Acidobacteriota bacterium]NIQ31666.1 GNAT family N-acetyltransferase [Acidobacteriota bacterium]NIQ86905.1 GNAT family N-acetyltransferase [Acidobacteriota bacterium]
MKIEILEGSDAEVKQELIDRVRAFNTAAIGEAEIHPLTVIARDEDDALIGGVSGRTICGHYLIEVVWVAESVRGQGLGAKLMNEAERRARELGCYGAQVDTVSFQAPGFYEKLGFRVIGTVEDFPRGHARHFLQKDYS